MAMHIRVNASQLRNTINELCLEETPLEFYLNDTQELLTRLIRGGVESETIGEIQAAVSLLEEAQFGLKSMVNELIAFLERYQKLQSLPLPGVSDISLLSINPTTLQDNLEGSGDSQALDPGSKVISFVIMLAKKLRKGIPDVTFRNLLKEHLLQEFGIKIDDLKEWKTEELVLLAEAVQDFQQGAGWAPAQFKKL